MYNSFDIIKKNVYMNRNCVMRAFKSQKKNMQGPITN